MRRFSGISRFFVAMCGALVGELAWSLLCPPASATTQSESPYAATLQMGRVLAIVENEYVDPVDRTKLVNGAIKGMVAELDPHSSFLPPHDFTEFQDDTEGKFAGVGIEVEAKEDGITILAPIEGSPAFRAGVKSGDHVLAIDGEVLVVGGAQALDKMVKKMRGAPGTHVKLTVRREGAKDPITFDLVREIVHVPSVDARLLARGVAYIRIKQFQDATHDELVRAAARLKAQGKIEGMILDLRSNPGGLVDEAAAVADDFLASGKIFSTRHRGKILDEVEAGGGGAFVDVPVAILVNEYSASAAELVAGALQDNKRALVIGANTFGKGSVQSILELPEGAGLRLTTARYYTPSGHAIQADGIHPDVRIDVPASDAALEVHERDLEGALAREENGGGAARGGDAGAAYVVPDGGDLEPRPIRDAAPDPSNGPDFGLKIAYATMRDRLLGKGPLVRP